MQTKTETMTRQKTGSINFPQGIPISKIQSLEAQGTQNKKMMRI